MNLPLSVASLIFFYSTVLTLHSYDLLFRFILSWKCKCTVFAAFFPICPLFMFGFLFALIFIILGMLLWFSSHHLFYFLSVILLPFSFAGLLFYGFGTYHLQLMHTICLLKRTQWFSNATNKDNNKCLLINTFSSTFQCFRSKTRLISNHCVFFRHEIYFIFDHFHYDFYWTTVLYIQFLFSSVQICTAMLLSYINIIK